MCYAVVVEAAKSMEVSQRELDELVTVLGGHDSWISYVPALYIPVFVVPGTHFFLFFIQ